MGYVTGYGNPPGYVAYWGNGDGRFLYPANMDVNGDKTPYVKGPVNSIRWEMLREGLEDYEYFALLSKLTQNKGTHWEKDLLQVPETIIKSQTEFTKDPQAMYKHRRELAEAIERMR